MIKNKTLYIKIIFKIYLKYIKNILGFFILQKSKNNFKKLFLKTIFQNY